MSIAPQNPAVTVPTCPVCATPLRLGSEGELDHWSCPHGHGLAMTLSETYGRLQDDEIAQLWQLARRAPAGPLPSPFDGRPMVRLELGYDEDEIPEGQPGDGPDIGSVELDELPHDLPNAPPSPEVLAREAEIRERFGTEIGEALEALDDRELTERMYNRLARNPAMLRTIDRVGRAVTSY